MFQKYTMFQNIHTSKVNTLELKKSKKLLSNCVYFETLCLFVHKII